MLLRAADRRLEAKWQIAMLAWPKADAAAGASQTDDWALQTAMEIAYQQELCRQLPAGLDANAPMSPAVQVAFCIDVRSEVFRVRSRRATQACRHLGLQASSDCPSSTNHSQHRQRVRSCRACLRRV